MILNIQLFTIRFAFSLKEECENRHSPTGIRLLIKYVFKLQQFAFELWSLTPISTRSDFPMIDLNNISQSIRSNPFSYLLRINYSDFEN